jgi:hypothetical protein
VRPDAEPAAVQGFHVERSSTRVDPAPIVAARPVPFAGKGAES